MNRCLSFLCVAVLPRTSLFRLPVLDAVTSFLLPHAGVCVLSALDLSLPFSFIGRSCDSARKNEKGDMLRVISFFSLSVHRLQLFV